MTTHRVPRTVRSAAALTAVTAALALGLTACGGAGNDSKAAGGDHSAGSAGAATKELRSATAMGGAQEIASKAAPTTDAQPCRGDELAVSAVHRFAGEQGDHLLLTAVNEGTKPCWVTSYPAVVLDWNVDNRVLPHSRKDNPGGDKHITLQPGGKAYSAVNLFDYGSKNRTAQSLAIALRGTDGRSGPFYSVAVKGQKPQFSWNEADVLNWNTKKPYDF
ncbi:DUF4232 domain-containing protein [Streptomyces sp. NPDC038707]|uniref:DUF4232 domain-containing protein n=1 Tax=Streptomyces sp. NPDC038707 TaxID=3154329 RepID=UPI0033FD5E9F